MTASINLEIRNNMKQIRAGWDSAGFHAREIATALEIAAMDVSTMTDDVMLYLLALIIAD